MSACRKGASSDEMVFLPESEDTQSSGEVSTCLGLLRRIAPIAVISAMMHIFMMLEVHIYIPYLYSRVSCCAPGTPPLSAHFDIADPAEVEAIRQESVVRFGFNVTVDARGQIPACDVPKFPKSSSLWSLSARCPNKAFVQQSAQGIMAVMKPLQKVFSFFILPIGGALADAWGRRPVLCLYAGGLVLACLLSAFDAFSNAACGNSLVYIAGCLFGFSFQPKDSIISAAVADLMGNNGVRKGRTFVALRTLDCALSIVVNSCTYVYLSQHHANYYRGWLTFGVVAFAIVAVAALWLEETLPKHLRSSPDPKVFIPLYSQCQSMDLVCGDAVLNLQAVIAFCFYAYFLGFITVKTSYLTLIGFKMEDAVLLEVFASASVFVTAVVLMPLIARLGVWKMAVLGNFLFAMGYVLMGPFTLYISNYGPFLAAVFFQNGVMVTFPAFQTIVSQRAGPLSQGKAQASISALGTLGAVLGIPLYNMVLFDATAHGFARATCPIASLLLALLCVALTCVVRSIGEESEEGDGSSDGGSSENVVLELPASPTSVPWTGEQI